MGIKARYHIQSNGTISQYTGEGDCIALHMTDENTLMLDEISIKNLSMELTLKGILTAQTEFMTQFVIPSFSSELETKDSTGVIERFSNMPGRSIKRKEENEEETDNALGISGKILADAAGIASQAAMTAAEAASVAKTAISIAMDNHGKA